MSIETTARSTRRQRTNIIVGIYCIENQLNKKKYLGHSTNILNRICEHKRQLRKGIHFNRLLQESYLLDGEENFIYYVVQNLDNDETLLRDMEIYWVAYYNSYYLDGGGYNMSRGGGGVVGFIATPEDISRRSIAHTGLPSPRKGAVCTEENKAKLSASMKGKTNRRGKKAYDSSKNTSQYVGVSWETQSQKWRSLILIDGKTVCLGRFTSEKEAALKYNEGALKHYGEDSRLNIIT